MPGRWPTLCAPTGETGAPWPRRIRLSRNCASFAATKSPSSNNAPPWSTNSAPPCANITTRPWLPLTIGPSAQPGNSSCNFPIRKNWPRPAEPSGKSSCTPIGCGVRKPPRNAWRFLPAPPIGNATPRSPGPKAA